jgi:NF-kappa-B inhibitor-like protein 1
MGSEKKRKKQHRKEDSKLKKKRKKEKEKEKRRRRSPSSDSGSGGSSGGGTVACHQDLLLAAALGDRPRCRELVDQGADVAYADAQGTTALHEVLPLLPLLLPLLPLLCLFARGRSHMPGSKAPPPLCCCLLLLLLQACRHGHLAAARLLLRRGADAGLGDRRGDTPAHLAARHGHLDLLAALLQSGGAPCQHPSALCCAALWYRWLLGAAYQKHEHCSAGLMATWLPWPPA